MKLQAKVSLVLVPLALLSGMLILVFSKQGITAILIEEVAERCFLELRDKSSKIDAGMHSEDERQLLPILNIVKEQMHASYAMALGSSARVLAHTNVVEKGKTYSDAITHQALSHDKPGFQLIDVEGKKIIDVFTPIWAQDEDFLLSQEKGGKTRLGTLRVGLPFEEALATRAKILGRIALILLVAGGIMVAVIFVFLRKMLFPVRMLVESTHKISRGDYSVAIPVQSRDELGELAQSFNQMSDTLAKTTVSRDRLAAEVQERQKAEEKLLLFRSLIDQSNDPIFVIDPSNGHFLDVNEKACIILGYAKNELMAMGAPDIIVASPDDVSWKNMEQEVRSRGFILIDGMHRRKDGGTFPVEVSFTYINVLERSYMVAVARDVTERKKLQLQMIQSEKLSAVGQLAAGVAHEINNPLGIILGFAQSARKKIQESDALSLPITSIEREALRCKNLVQNLLTFSRQTKAQIHEVAFNETVASILSIVEAQARVKSVEIFRELGPLPSLLCDRNQLQQVVVNLCNNAIDAMPDGGKIVVRTSSHAIKNERWIVLEIEDSGSGIPEEIRDKIFNPFFTTKEVGKGTGLGLSLVYEIIQRHKGTIEVKSEVGRGSTFSVSLPVGMHEAQIVKS